MRNRRIHTAISVRVLIGATCAAALTATVAQENAATAEIEAIRADLETLRGSLPSQSHTMADVEFHYANLWFAGKNEDWPLATFYLNETRSHLNWTVRVRPVRRVSTGELDLRPILAAIEGSALTDLKTAIDGQDGAAFDTAYRAMMNQCYACHLAAEKPYLRPHIPETPPSPMMNRAVGADAGR